MLATYSAGGDVVELGGGNGGQSDDGSEGEGLHFGVNGFGRVFERRFNCGNDGMLGEDRTEQQRFIHQCNMRLH